MLIFVLGSSGTCNQGDPIGQANKFCGNQLHTVEAFDMLSIPICGK